MMDLTILELVLFFVAVGGVMLVARPYVPSWAWFAFDLGLALYFFLHILDDGPDTMEVVLVVGLLLAAANIWRRDLRRVDAGTTSRPRGP